MIDGIPFVHAHSNNKNNNFFFIVSGVTSRVDILCHCNSSFVVTDIICQVVVIQLSAILCVMCKYVTLKCISFFIGTVKSASSTSRSAIPEILVRQEPTYTFYVSFIHITLDITYNSVEINSNQKEIQ